MGSPGVKNKLKLTLIKSKKIIARKPLSIILIGTLESLIHNNKKIVISTYPVTELLKKRAIIKIIVPKSFVLGSIR